MPGLSQSTKQTKGKAEMVQDAETADEFKQVAMKDGVASRVPDSDHLARMKTHLVAAYNNEEEIRNTARGDLKKFNYKTPVARGDVETLTDQVSLE